VTAKARAKRKRERTKGVGAIREYVFARERDICRCCRKRRAESMHEITFRSQGGKVSKKNSIAVCGNGTAGCHGYIQHHEIEVGTDTRLGLGAEGTLAFVAKTRAAADYMAIQVNELIESPVMVDMELAE
jgi:hypothetical protein